MQIYKDQTLAEIVSQMHQAAAIFEKHHLDFCCRGKRTLQDACTEKQLPADIIEAELQQVADNASQMHDVATHAMSAAQLADYIVLKHHLYVKESMPVILQHVQRVATKHGDRFPYMQQVQYLFTVLREEMTSHMQKEELVLFPRIKEIEQNGTAALIAGYISQPVLMMEAEHDEAGGIMAEIRKLTRDYTVPEGACTTFRISLAELKEFEEDLHRHVHLENNILFPKALQLVQSL
jgi:regulator of cell morphogenesis and NO signaling